MTLFIQILSSFILLGQIHGNNITSSSKRGLAVPKKRFICGDVAAFSGVSWWYNWGYDPVIDSSPDCPVAPGFVPMIWGHWTNSEFPPLPEYDTVLGFNEPNHHDQANLDPESAAMAWLELQEAYPDKTLVSPCASPPATEEWFDEFFEICDALGCRVDYLATHSYTGNAQHDKEFLSSLYERKVCIIESK